MPKSLGGPVRRGQLIAPFGVGSMVVVPGGTSLIVGGLDSWFEAKDENRIVDVEEYKVSEWRLQKLLGVDHFRLPPDYRDSYWNQGSVNSGLTIPAFRFPTWHFCSGCRRLIDFPLYTRGKNGKIKCPDCEKNKKTKYLSQVRFITMCESGHVQDFPWREWVHGQHEPGCDGDLHLISTGSAALAGQLVRCDCGKERTLSRITEFNIDGSTYLSNNLSGKDDPFLCHGKKPWLGENEFETCNSPLRGSLRGASNLYFAKVASSIYIPISEDPNLQRLENILQTPPVSTLISTLKDIDATVEQIARAIRKNHVRLVVEFTDDQIKSTLDNFQSDNQSKPDAIDEDEWTSFRRSEYAVLKSERNDEFLTIREADLTKYQYNLMDYFSKVMFVSKMRETRVLSGFTRVFADNNQSRDHRQGLLWKEIPSQERWLPAYTVFGEGLFFEFAEQRLAEWENSKFVMDRIDPLIKRNAEMLRSRHLQEREVSARFVLLHTFSHLLMNRLTYECGYSSAALRERIYVSHAPGASMSGVLIYTADGDSEGTMGGLVRMGKPNNLEPIILRAIENAKWCSSDPVCMELGSGSGQGPDSCNLAACHNCALVPETACEEFNHLLDRGVVIGDFEHPNAGFFNFE